MATKTVQLYGGAITAQLPAHLIDASDLRQVPDQQEVWLDNDSNLSWILEVVQLVTQDGAQHDQDSAIRFLFQSLAHDNSALSSEIEAISVAPLPLPLSSATTPALLGPTTLVGIQKVSKFNLPPEKADSVLILMALWRIPEKNSDLVLCVNFPVREAGGEEVNAEAARDTFDLAVRTLLIKDYGLFAG